MMSKCFLLVCLTVGLCSAQLDVSLGDLFQPGDVFPIDKQVDQVLPQISKLIRLEGYDSGVVLPDMGLEAAPIFIGVTLDGFSRLTRSGAAVMTVPAPNQLGLRMTLRVNRPQIHVALCPYMRSNFTWDLDFVDFEVSLRLVPSENKNGCVTTYDYFRLLRLGNITQLSGNPAFDRVPPVKEAVDLVIPRYNLAFKNKEVLAPVGKDLDLCKRD